ncbi:MAG TPA: pullulanase-associated domain-containing protein, partial [Albitalea sp.]|nr:pullulanase-associated domain-containing protein [Albitalea sp.]
MKNARHLLQAALAVALSAGALAPAFAQSSNPPAGFIAINYNRCDNNYEGWGAHLWKNPGIPLTGIEWQKPMPPTGKTDFGPYWHADLKDFGSSGKVNYIIHKGDSKEQGGRDMSFDGTKVTEIWVNSGDKK